MGRIVSAPALPRLADDYTPAAAEKRLAFLREATGVSAEHISRHCLDPSLLPGNIENFVGVAQVPIGIAGPLRCGASTLKASSWSHSPPRRERSLPATTGE